MMKKNSNHGQPLGVFPDGHDTTLMTANPPLPTHTATDVGMVGWSWHKHPHRAPLSPEKSEEEDMKMAFWDSASDWDSVLD